MLLTVKVERVRLVFRLNAFDFLRKKSIFRNNLETNEVYDSDK